MRYTFELDGSMEIGESFTVVSSLLLFLFMKRPKLSSYDVHICRFIQYENFDYTQSAISQTQDPLVHLFFIYDQTRQPYFDIKRSALYLSICI